MGFSFQFLSEGTPIGWVYLFLQLWKYFLILFQLMLVVIQLLHKLIVLSLNFSDVVSHHQLSFFDPDNPKLGKKWLWTVVKFW